MATFLVDQMVNQRPMQPAPRWMASPLRNYLSSEPAFLWLLLTMELVKMQISGPHQELLFHWVWEGGEAVFLQVFPIKWALRLWRRKIERGTGLSSTVFFCHPTTQGRLDHITVSLGALYITHGWGWAHHRTSMDGWWMGEWMNSSVDLDDAFSKVNISSIT